MKMLLLPVCDNSLATTLTDDTKRKYMHHHYKVNKALSFITTQLASARQSTLMFISGD